MKNKSDSVQRKFIDIVDVDEYEILTDDGWKDISFVGKTEEYQIYEIKTQNHSLKCADTHILFDEQMNEVFAKDVKRGDYIQTDSGIEEVVYVKQLHECDNMYDVQVNSNEHRYFTNGILSHNSTIYCIYSLWLATFWADKKIMILANKLSTALELHGRIQMGYEYLPKWLKCGLVTLNKGEITFSNKSSIRAFSSSSDAARGFSCNVIICDEFAFLKKNLADKLFTSMYPTISSSKSGKFIIVSTPNGTSNNLYYDIWCQANSKDVNGNLDGWKPFEMYWWQVPGHDEEWKKKQIAAIGERRFNQEFDNQFLASSDTNKLIADDIITKHKERLTQFKKDGVQAKRQKIVSQSGDEVFEFEMWHEFNPTHAYVASGDIAEGVGADSSVLYIWDVTYTSKITMCARFSSNTVSVVQFAYIANEILKLYGKPWLACERNGVSIGMLDSLRITYGYPSIVVENKKNEPGIFSHVTVKERACAWCQEMMTTRGIDFIIYDKCLLDEFGMFAKKDTKGIHNVYQALPGPNSHDDHVMSFIWMTYVLQNEILEKYFVCCETFVSDFDKTYAKTLQPLYAYTDTQVKDVYDNQMYKDFVEFKEELAKKLKTAVDINAEEAKNDIFKYKMTQHDYYFGDDNDGCGSWNSPSYGATPCRCQPLNQNARAPAFVII